MNNWIITDPAVIEALQQNGFICREPGEGNIGVIHFDTQPKRSRSNVWYETDCPVKWNGGRYTLPDGRVLLAEMTTLSLVDEGKD